MFNVKSIGLLYMILIQLVFICSTIFPQKQIDPIPENQEIDKSSSSVSNLRGDIYLFLVGINNYDDQRIDNLEFSYTDVSLFDYTMRQYKSDLYNNIHTKFLSDTELMIKPTKQNINSILNEEVSKLKETDLFIFYFSGHGISYNKENYLIPADSQYKDLETVVKTSISLNEIINKIKSSKAKKKIIILDSCHSGIEANKDIEVRAKMSEELQGLIDENNKSEGIIILSSCSYNQKAYDDKTKKQGIFSYFLSQGLSGQANSMGNDEYVDVVELSYWVGGKVSDWAKKHNYEQTPTIYEIASGKFPLTKTDINWELFWEKFKRKEGNLLAAIESYDFLKYLIKNKIWLCAESPEEYFGVYEKCKTANREGLFDVEKRKLEKELMEKFNILSLCFKDYVEKMKADFLSNYFISDNPYFINIFAEDIAFIKNLGNNINRPLNDFEYVDMYKDLLYASDILKFLKSATIISYSKNSRFLILDFENKRFIVDTMQGLIFTYRYEEEKTTWQAAFAKSKKCRYLFKDDWRLPTENEFLGTGVWILDRELFGFASRLSDFYWCNERDEETNTAPAFNIARRKITQSSFIINDTNFRNYFVLVRSYKGKKLFKHQIDLLL